MKGKVLFVVGLGVGYVLGTRAGRRRYEQIKSVAVRVWDSPTVQKQVHTVQDYAADRIGDLGTAVTEGVKRAVTRSGGSQGSASKASSRSTGSSTSSARSNSAKPSGTNASTAKGATAKTSAAKTSAAKTSAAKTVAKGTLKAAKPKVKGKAKVGKKLTAKPGTWTAGTKLTYKWFANGKAIKGATHKTLKLKKSLKGKRITVKVTGTKAGYAKAAKVSKKTGKVKKR